MASITLTPYVIRIKKKREEGWRILSRFDEDNADFFQVLKDFLDTYKTSLSNDDSRQKVLRVKKADLSKRSIKGIIETGEYGYASEIYNLSKGKKAYVREKDDAELLPFYFYFLVPNEKQEGIAVFQSFGKFGIKSILQNSLDTYFKKNYADFSVEFNPLFHREILKLLLDEGLVTKIRFIKYELPKDIADAYADEANLKKDEGTTELVVKIKNKKKGAFLNKKLKNFINNQGNVKEFLEITDFQYDNVKVEINFKGKTKTINLSDYDKVRPGYDVTEDVEFGDKGHPKFESIDLLARDIIDTVKEQIQIEVDDANV